MVRTHKTRHPNWNKRQTAALFSLAAASALFAVAAPAQSPMTNPLITGKKITQPPLGALVGVGSLPMNMVLTPDGKYAVVSDMGFHQLLSVLDTKTGQKVSSLEFGSPSTRANPGLYYGLAIQPNNDGTHTLYASQGNNHTIGVLNISASGALAPIGTIPMGATDFAAGIALDGSGYLYVAVNQNYSGGSIADATTPSSLVVYNTAAPGVISATLPTVKNSPAAAAAVETARYNFGPKASAVNPTGSTPNYPYAVVALSSGHKVYVTSQRDDAVFVFDTSNPAAPALLKTITSGAASGTQAHPISLLFNKAQSRLFIAYAHGDSIATVDTSADTILSAISLRPAGATDLPGATPTGLALTPDESRLYVTLGDMNAVGVVDLAAGNVVGYIPAGWYPSAIIASPFKKQILVANAKGTSARNPNPGYVYSSSNSDPNYGLYLTVGNVETIPVPNMAQQAAETQMVLANNKITAHTSEPANPLAAIGFNAGKIKHIVYIIKENRTYDQVLGDIPSGNGDPSLAIFGSKTGVQVTPNQHALANRFVLLDNFFDCGEASGDGWPWSTQGQANEAIIKDLPYNYSGRGRNYDYEGSNNNYPTGGFPAVDPHGQPLVGPSSPFYQKNAPAITDVSEAPGGHIWDDAGKAGRTYRNYGFFTSFGVGPSSSLLLPSNIPGSKGLQPVGTIPTTLGGATADFTKMGVSDFDMRGYDQNFADSEAAYIYAYGAAPTIPANATAYPVQSTTGTKGLFAIPTFGYYNSPSRVSEFKREFAEMLKADSTGDTTVPNFIMLKYSNDHTQGYRTNAAGNIHSPRAGVADNDYAVGQTIDLLSHSPIWNNTAVFVIEDDAQDGPDHIDSHRSTCYVISPYIKRASVDHTFYNTDSVLKTMELLLNVPPMNQYDAIATPILDFALDTFSNGDVYNAILPDKSIIQEYNPSMMLLKRGTPLYNLATLSNKMDFVHPDSAPAALLNQIIWKSVKGVHAQMPAPRHNHAIESKLHLTKPIVGKKTVKTARDADD
jgi:YVTN family beta-propeller protein